MLPLTWARQFLHNGHGILRVLDITRARPMPAGLVNKQHPWVTGINPATGNAIWHDNVLFQSPRPSEVRYPADDAIITRVGRFLADLVARSAVVPEIPWGPRRRMPHGINYIHGTVHYNSGILIFNDFAEAIYYFSDRRFRNEVCRFARIERREVLIIFRERRYTARDYAYLMGFLRSVLPWFCNSNGPLKRVMWGNPSPFPVVNIIAGNWIDDVYRLKTEAGKQEVVRPPVRRGKYLHHGDYRGTRRERAGRRNCSPCSRTIESACAARAAGCSSSIAASFSPPNSNGCARPGSRMSRWRHCDRLPDILPSVCGAECLWSRVFVERIRFGTRPTARQE